MNKKSILHVVALLSAIFLFTGCSWYTGVTVQDKKVILAVSNASSVVCDIGADGMLSNCKDN